MATEYNISKTASQCCSCRRELGDGEEFVATVIEGDEELHRNDYCLACWDADGRPQEADLLGLWRGRLRRRQEKKRLFVDDELLINFFERLEDADDPAKVGFRFVLALVLMRKKLLVYDRSETADGADVWTMHLKGSQDQYKVIDPHMDEDKIAEVSQQLGDILEGQL